MSESLPQIDFKNKAISAEAKTKIHSLIRKTNLSEDAINQLWDIEYFRWDLIRNQTFTKEKIDKIIDDIIKKKVKERHKIINYLLKYQTVSSDHYIKLTSTNNLSNTIVLDLWYSVPEKLLECTDYTNFLEIVKEERHLNSRLKNKFIKTIDKFCKVGKKTDEVIDTLIASYTPEGLKVVVLAISKNNYIDDTHINTLQATLGDEFKDVANVLIARDNCSTPMKAKLILLK